MASGIGRAQSDTRLFIGVDGGGTGCRARIEDADGRILGTGIAGPAAVRLGIDRTLAAVETACRAAVANAGLEPETLSEMHACVGVAGVNRKGAREALTARQHLFRSVLFVNDATIACIGAHRGRDGGIVIVGTGSIGFAVVKGGEVRFGGYGFPISDEGSGAELGLQALRMALRGHDGRARSSRLTREIMAKFGDDPFEMVAWADRATATDYAAFAPVVMQSAQSGDAVARHIVQEAARQIDELVRRLIECRVPRITLVGGLAASIGPWLSPDIRHRLVPPEGDAISGAVHLAQQELTPSW